MSPPSQLLIRPLSDCVFDGHDYTLDQSEDIGAESFTDILSLVVPLIFVMLGCGRFDRGSRLWRASVAPCCVVALEDLRSTFQSSQHSIDAVQEGTLMIFASASILSVERSEFWFREAGACLCPAFALAHRLKLKQSVQDHPFHEILVRWSQAIELPCGVGLAFSLVLSGLFVSSIRAPVSGTRSSNRNVASQKTINLMSLDDQSRRWLLCLVSHALNVDSSIVDNMLVGATTELVQSFFSAMTQAGSVLFFYRKEEQHQVEEEVEEEAEVTKEESSTEPSKETVSPAGSTNGQVLNEEANVSPTKSVRRMVKQLRAVPRPVCHVALNTLPYQSSEVTTVFLIKVATGPITVGTCTANAPENVIPTNVEIGCSTGDLLSNLEGIICHVFMPLLDPQLSNANVSAGQGCDKLGANPQSAPSKIIDAIRNEFWSNLVKFSSQIASAIQRIHGNIQLTIPNVIITKPESHLDDSELINQLERAQEDWSQSITSIVDQESRKSPRRKGPLAEIEFWRERNGTLSTIYEQINMPIVQKMLKLLELTEGNTLSAFKYHLLELTKLHVEAKDNVKFLTTLERHFKIIATGSFSAIADTLPSMMNAIRMVWIISRHYNTDERMVPLMERITSEIVDKVAVEIDIHTILRQSPTTALLAIREAKTVLESWHTTYLNVRERIEASGTDHRWEFDRKRLFEQTDYMAKICENLHEVATALDQFHQFLGPELKSVTGNAQGIDHVKVRVEHLIVPFETIRFEIFDRENKTSWDSVMVDFRAQVLEIEHMTQKFIDTSFQKLRSAEGAFDLLQNFQTIQSRESINQQMMGKYTDILMQYSKEVDLLEDQFHRYQTCPPVYKHYPPVAGAISWSRALYLRAKKPILRFRSRHDLLKSPQGEQVKEKYLVFARAVDAYIQRQHREWKDRVPAMINELLKQSILGPKLVEAGKSETGGVLVQLPPPPFYANFSAELVTIIKESKYLDRLGLEIPEEALNVTLQEDKYLQYVQDLTLMLERYHSLLNDLTPVESHLLRIHLTTLGDALRAGFYPLNWNSQRVLSFLESSNKALDQFATLVSQIHKSSQMVEEIVLNIEQTLLIQIEDFGDGVVLEVSEFYELVERNRMQRIDDLVQGYRSIGPLLIKIEEIVAGVNTGTSSALSTYYRYWERRVFNAITAMIIASMTTFQALLNIHTNDMSCGTFFTEETKVKRPPLCKVKATMHGKDIIVTPSLSDTSKYVSKCVKHIVESAKAFIRWMDGTCRETAPLMVNDDDEPITFTFYSDISQNPYVIKMTLSLNQEIHKVYHLVNRYLDSWRRYDTVYNLWNPKRQSALDKLVDKKPPFVYFDTRMAQYSRLAESVRTQATEKDTDFLQIQCQPLALSIAKQAERWKDDYGRILLEISTKKLAAISATMDALDAELAATPEDLASLKAVLHTVAEISDMGMDMELEYTDIIERYRTLQTFHITCDGAEFQRAFSLETRWRTLVIASKTKDLRLLNVKAQFQEDTKQKAIAFAHKCMKLQQEIAERGPGTYALDLDAGLENLSTFQMKLRECQKMHQELASAENLFALRLSSYPELQEVAEALENYTMVYTLFSDQRDFISNLSSMLWADLDVAAMTKGLEELEKRCRLIRKDLKAMPILVEVEKQILAFRESVPLIQSLKHEAVKPRHWQELMSLTEIQGEPNPKTLTLKMLAATQLHRFPTDIANIVHGATQEQKIEHELKKIQDSWSKTGLELEKYTNNGTERGWVLRAAEDIREMVANHLLNLQAIASSRYNVHFAEQVRTWTARLGVVTDCLDIWFLVQRKWIYLESIFVGADDLRQQLPDEARRFDAIDKAWKALMAVTSKQTNAIEACTAENRVEILQSLSDRLDTCQKSLSHYLETKRQAFPRFFFISDDELLSVLSSSNPTSIQMHLLKLFDNVKRLTFVCNDKSISAMESAEGDRFDFKTLAAIEGPVELWMTNVEKEMRVSLQRIAKEGVFQYASLDRISWLETVLGMVSLVGSQIWWTWQVEDAFRRVNQGDQHAMKGLEKQLSNQLQTLVRRVRDPLELCMRIKVTTLLVLDVHARDIVDSFVRESIVHENEFAWESQLRFYWRKEVDNVVICQCTGSFRYGYEFMGLAGRLVITPLTLRCYMTLTQALTFNLGGSLTGPAGTGKTETVKDLAKALALPCYVINCGNGLDYQAMARLFSGLVQVGAWGCFDEFNRIKIDVLSVVSAQLRAIQTALHHDASSVDIGFGPEITIYRIAGLATCGVFITMNPGYAGRTELPHTLKVLFRPVTMVIPDMLQICQIMLYSEGFEHAVALAKKMTVLYRLSSEQFSKQYHYDFGLRALKSVLVLAGALKREYSDMTEEVVLMRALRDSNMPKFVFEDVPLFYGLLNDLFPGLDCPRLGYCTLTTSIETELKRGDYNTSDSSVSHEQIQKILQLYETMLVRHTTMVVGPTGGGKTLILNTLAAASLSACNATVRIFVLNPKAQPIAELYGTLNSVTRVWTDGVLSRLFRALNQPLESGEETEKRWLILDGDVDAEWVENMNSVMDDNKLLTLPNGERLRLEAHCSIICETFNLHYASPATISRCGIVWVDPKQLGHRPYYERWVKKKYPLHPTGSTLDLSSQSSAKQTRLLEVFDQYVPPCMAFIRHGTLAPGDTGANCQQVIPISNIEMCKQLCVLLDGSLPQGDTTAYASVQEVFLFSLVWSLGAALLEPSRARLNDFIRQLATCPLPTTSLYDTFFDADTRQWLQWDSRVVPYIEPSPFHFSHVLVPTTDSVRANFLLSSCLGTATPLLFVGESGTAKTVTIQKYLNTLDPQLGLALSLTFSSRTSSLEVQTRLQMNVVKHLGKIYGPPAGKKLLIFIDDLHMPTVDSYGTQEPLALLHCIMNRGRMYNRSKELDVQLLTDLQFIGAMRPPGGGRHSVDPRLVAQFSVFNLPPPSTQVLCHIFGSIVTTYLRTFSDEIQSQGMALIHALLQCFDVMLEKLPPTPSKFHYIFNLRDLKRVCEGICMATPDAFDSSVTIVRLWRNEITRIFSDRLMTDSDRAVVEDAMTQIIRQTFPNEAEAALANPLLFGDYGACMERITSPTRSKDALVYQDMGSYRRVRGIFDEALEMYNVDHIPMTLVLFEVAVEHLSRILRILRNPQGHALLIGVGGSGKKSLSKLAAFIAGYDLFEICLTRGYSDADFRENLKDLYGMLGLKPVVFLFTEAHAVDEGFLEYINYMVTSGMVPGLFETEERIKLATLVQDQVKAAGLVETSDSCWQFYLELCRQNLHVILAMSPSGNALRTRCRSFPGLVSATIIDCFFAWPEDALRHVAHFFLSEANLRNNLRDQVANHLVHAHLHIVRVARQFSENLRRHYHVTPRNYLAYLFNYCLQLKENHVQVTASIDRLQGGLAKLMEAAQAVDRMQLESLDQKRSVDDKTLACEALIKTIEEKSSLASTQQEIAITTQRECERASVLMAREKEKANAALVQALPAVEAAAAALQDLSKADLTELKSFASPPPLVLSVCMCVLILQPTGQELDLDWKGAKIMLSHANLMTLLKEYELDRISAKMITKIKAFFKQPELSIDNMKSISRAGAGLLVWVFAIVKYYDVAKNVDPLRQKVKTMEQEHAIQEHEVAVRNASLVQLKSDLEKLSAQLHDATVALQTLQLEADHMQKRLQAASRLLVGLGSERTRWTNDIASLHRQSECLVGDCLLTAGFLSYAGALTFEYRSDLIYRDLFQDLKARNVPVTTPFRLETLLTNETSLQQWISDGLPTDEYSLQNGILTTKSNRFPLCIDPQQQAVTWIKRMEEKNTLIVKTLQDADFMKQLELAIQFGHSFLCESVDEDLDPMLDPVLEQKTFLNGAQRLIKLGENTVVWDANFRLYLTSKLANPHYSPEVMGKTTIVNYSVTQDGLANQLLTVVVAHERPEVEEQFRNLVVDMASRTQLIGELETNLLRELSTSSGNILDHDELIVALEDTMKQACAIRAQLELASLTKEKMTSARAVYSPVALRGSILYVAMAALATLMAMYETSLASFLTVFHTALQTAPRESVLERRLESMVQTITACLYDYTCTGIFERHKLMFAFQLTCMIKCASNELNCAELDFFLKGSTSLDAVVQSKPEHLPWISQVGWKDLMGLSQLHDGGVFTSILSDVTTKATEWKAWYDLEAPERVALPSTYASTLSGLQKLILLRIFRPDRVYNAMRLFVMFAMGDKFGESPGLDYGRIYRQSNATSPIVCILSPGADPQREIQRIGSECGFSDHRFKVVALGQGQGPVAAQLVVAGAVRGHWVVLQNCHLVAPWLRTLDTMLQAMTKPHRDFRLWLTTEPTDRFPLGLLQRSFKVVTEPPNGLKPNMRTLYAQLEPTMLDECPHAAYGPVVYVLCFLHAVVLERRKYGKIGWNVSYDFDESDFTVSRHLLHLYFLRAYTNQEDELPWASLKHLLGDVMYGGRVSDDYDRRILTTYLAEYMGDFVFDECQQFYFSRSGFDYVLPGSTSRLQPLLLDDYVATVEALPFLNSPAVFGLHPNAEIGYYTNLSKSVWKDLLALQPRSAPSGTGGSREAYIMTVASDILSKVPEPLDVELIRKQIGATPSPTQIVLLQELDRWNRLTREMRESLENLHKVLVGESSMSDELEAMGHALHGGDLPPLWRSVCPKTEKPLGSWMEQFTKRFTQYMNWVTHGDPRVMWLSGLSVPESYLTALVQVTCRAKNWPLDKSTLYTHVTNYTHESQVPLDDIKSDAGCYVMGLFLEGASWDLEQGCLVPQKPKILVTELPIMHIIPIEASRLEVQNTFRTPVYVTQSRRNAMGVGLVFEADLYSTVHASHWILQGVALTLNSEY